MKKYVVLAVNDNPKYGFYLPLLVFAWRSFGWDVIILYVGQKNERNDLIFETFNLLNSKLTKVYQDYYRLVVVGIDSVPDYKTETIAQISRLYACCLAHESVFLMTSDADMLPLTDYWQIQGNALFTANGQKQYYTAQPTAWGRDLTDYHYPICYIGMQVNDWINVMQLSKLDPMEMIHRDLKAIKPRAGIWCLDQDIITQRIMEYGEHKFRKVNRGIDKRTGYPLGRVDRSNWHMSHERLIDAHLPHDILTNDDSYKKVLDLCKHVWPKMRFEWFEDYYNKFKKLV